MLARCRATLGRKAAGLLSWRREHPSLHRAALLKQGHLGVGWTQVRIQLSISQQELIGHLLLRGRRANPSFSDHSPHRRFRQDFSTEISGPLGGSDEEAKLRALRMRSLAPKPSGRDYAQHLRQIEREEAPSKHDVFVNRILPGLRYFFQNHHHLNISKTYVIPDDDPGVPTAIRGFNLGKRVDNIRTRGDFVRNNAEYLEMLQSVGGETEAERFVWRSKDWIFTHQIMATLRFFKRRHGHLLVPRHYVCPPDPELARFNWGFTLGSVVHDIRDKNKGFYLDQEPERARALAEIDFPWEHKSAHTWQIRDVPALAWFKREHGHLAVPPDYACPTGRGALVSGLPKIALGMHLGRYADRIRRRGSTSPRDELKVKQLNDMGFAWSLPDHFVRRTLAPVVTYYVAKYGHLSPPPSYTVPWGIKDVPRWAWGMNLHDRIYSLRKSSGNRWAGENGSREERQARVALIELTVRLARDKHNDEVLDGEDDDMPSWEEKCEPALEFLRKRASKEVAGRGRTSNHKSTASTAK